MMLGGQLDAQEWLPSGTPSEPDLPQIPIVFEHQLPADHRWFALQSWMRRGHEQFQILDESFSVSSQDRGLEPRFYDGRWLEGELSNIRVSAEEERLIVTLHKEGDSHWQGFIDRFGHPPISTFAFSQTEDVWWRPDHAVDFMAMIRYAISRCRWEIYKNRSPRVWLDRLGVMAASGWATPGASAMVAHMATHNYARVCLEAAQRELLAPEERDNARERLRRLMQRTRAPELIVAGLYWLDVELFRENPFLLAQASFLDKEEGAHLLRDQAVDKEQAIADVGRMATYMVDKARAEDTPAIAKLVRQGQRFEELPAVEQQAMRNAPAAVWGHAFMQKGQLVVDMAHTHALLQHAVHALTEQGR